MGRKPIKNESLYWRYKKKTPPTEEFPGMNGEVIVTRPADVIIENNP